MLGQHLESALCEALITRQRAWFFTEPLLSLYWQQQLRKRARREAERSSVRLCRSRTWRRPWHRAGTRARSYGRTSTGNSTRRRTLTRQELGASLGPYSLSVVTNCFGTEQGEQLSYPARDEAGTELGDPLGAELRPALAQILEAALGTRTRRSTITRQRALCFTGSLLPLHCQQQPR